MTDSRFEERLGHLMDHGVPESRHRPSAEFPSRKVVAASAVLVLGTVAVNAAASARGRDPNLTGALVLYVAFFVLFGLGYAASFLRLYREVNDGWRLVGVGLTPDGLADEMFDSAGADRPRWTVATGVFLHQGDVILRIGGQNCLVRDAHGVDAGFASKGKRLWLVVAVSDRIYRIRLRGPVAP